MTRTTLAACGVCAFVTALSAQTPPAAQPAPAQPNRPPTGQSLTLTGCVKAWDPATMSMGGTGTTPATPGSEAVRGPAVQQFVLVNAAYAPPAAAARTTTVPGAGKPPGGQSPATGGHSTYLLKPAEPASVNLGVHLDHKVEVRGTLEPDPSARPDAAGTPGAPAGVPTPPPLGAGTPGTGTSSPGTTGTTPGSVTTGTGATGAVMSQKAGAAAAQTTFVVTSIKMIDKTCP